jgi:hypothetical protein
VRLGKRDSKAEIVDELAIRTRGRRICTTRITMRMWRLWNRGAMLLVGLLAFIILHSVARVGAETDPALQVTPEAHDFGSVKRL